MVDAARPGMGAGDSRDLGTAGPTSRGAKIFLPTPQTARNAAGRETFGNSSHGERAKQRQFWSPVNTGVRMTSFLRKPEAILWILSISQAAAMLAFNVVLRAAVS
jgi:hypothetical protein